MLVKESTHDVKTTVAGEGQMRIYVFHPTIPGYPSAKFPGVVVFSEIYQVTGPVARFARMIAGQGYICAAPSSYHEFTGPEPLQYNAEDTDNGNKWKITKIFGKNDNHVPAPGRDLIRSTLHEKGVCFSFYEAAWAQHAFIRDELSKGRYDPALTKVCAEMMFEVFGRTLKVELGEGDGKELVVENVC
ncbi:hypothetical protein GY632_5830 [Trichophyton interdigitale]|nr:hypothetical protein GY632_5830 [Trichophyton interdigitale]